MLAGISVFLIAATLKLFAIGQMSSAVLSAHLKTELNKYDPVTFFFLYFIQSYNLLLNLNSSLIQPADLP